MPRQLTDADMAAMQAEFKKALPATAFESEENYQRIAPTIWAGIVGKYENLPNTAAAQEAGKPATPAFGLGYLTQTLPAQLTPGEGAVSRFFAPVGQAIAGLPKMVYDAVMPEDPRDAAKRMQAVHEAVRQGNYGQAAVKAIPQGSALGVGGKVAEQAAQGSLAEAAKAKEAYDQGRYVEALGHAGGTIPIIGPGAAAAGELGASGDVAGMLGAAAVQVAPFLASSLPVTKGRIPAPIRTRVTPVIEAAIKRFGTEAGGEVPIDAATATNSPFLRGAQQLTQESMLGQKALEQRDLQVAALAKTRAQLGQQISPTAATDSSAGQGVFTDVLKAETEAAKRASAAYEPWDQAVESPGLQREVPRSPETMKKLEAQRAGRMREQFGDQVPTRQELQAMADIQTEMDELRYSQGKLVTDDIDSGTTHYVPRSAGANVIDDINANSINLSQADRPSAIQSINQALTTGEFNETARAALAVARKRLAGKWSEVGKPELPPGAGEMPQIPSTEVLQAPIDLGNVQGILSKALERLERQPGFAQRQVDPAVESLRDLVKGDRYRPLGDAERLAGALKYVEKGGKTAGSIGPRGGKAGLAAFEIRELEKAIQQGMTEHGIDPNMLKEARAATVEKYKIQNVRKKLAGTLGADVEPVKVYDRLLQWDGHSIGLLARVKKYAPQQIPKVGRALFDDLLTDVENTGNYSKALTRWKALHPKTKQLLYGSEVPALNEFFELANEMTYRINPSGSGMAVAKGAQIMNLFRHPIRAAGEAAVAGTIGKLLTSPGGAKLLTQGLRIPVRSPAATAAWAAQLQRALKELPADQPEDETAAAVP